LFFFDVPILLVLLLGLQAFGVPHGQAEDPNSTLSKIRTAFDLSVGSI
jgi:hypothetical protein